MSSIENSKKSRNGANLEKTFIKGTGYKKARKIDMPAFINEHGRLQIIDADFIIKKKEETIFVDVTTTWRSSRGKQKAYNGILLKTKTDIKNKYYIGVGSFIEGEQTTNPQSLEGIDGILLVEDLIKIINNQE